jgi:hypothetical protein
MVDWVKTCVEVPEAERVSFLGNKIIPAHTRIEWHTSHCLEASRQHMKDKTEYEARWPNYCRKCNGRGGHWTSFDPSPPGVALSPGSMPDFDPCTCVEPADDNWWSSRCPRCGTRWYTMVPTEEIKTMAAQYRAEGWTLNVYDIVEPTIADEHPCTSCGWDWGQTPDNGIHPDVECFCWERPDYPGWRERTEATEPTGVYAEYADLYEELEP